MQFKDKPLELQSKYRSSNISHVPKTASKPTDTFACRYPVILIPRAISGTLFDIAVHAVNAVCLSWSLTRQAVVVGTSVAMILVYVVLYNPRLAWASKVRPP